MSEIEKAREALAYYLKQAIEVGTLTDCALAGAAMERVASIVIGEALEAAGPWVCGACGAVPSPTCPHRGVAPQCGVPVRAAVNQEGGDPHSTDGRPAGHAGNKSPPAVEAPAAGDEAARRAYTEMTDNDPVVHSNRFPTWEELDEAERQRWRDKVRPSDTTALACQLAEALRDLSSWMMSAPVSIRTKALEALTEARKRGLIE